MTKTAFLFPGQGSQAVGMGKALHGDSAPARAVFEAVEDALDEPLGRLMFEGPEEALKLTRNAQPALMTTALAVIRTLEDRLGAGIDLGMGIDRGAGIDTDTRIDAIGAAVAGHSLGEYAALAAVGVIDITTAARLLRLRGEAMQEAVPVGTGAMAALLGVEIEQVEDMLASRPWDALDIANDNAPGQVVISGGAGDIDAALELAKASGIRKAIKLPVSAPFHCCLMAPAAEAMAAALKGISLNPPSLAVYCNVTAVAETTPARLRDNLIAQVTGRVRWRETLENMAADGITRFVEVGTGKVLTGLVKRTLPEAEAIALETSEDIDHFIEGLD